jgi:RNA polymerase sigma factor (sigma-70 family)
MATDKFGQPVTPADANPLTQISTGGVEVDVVTRVELRRFATPSPTPTSRLHTPNAADLLAGCRRGEHASWVALVNRYETLVYTVARRNGLNVEDAADVTQATFATLLARLDDLRDIDKLPSWLATVARRESWRVARRQKREHALSLNHETSGNDTDTEAEWAQREAMEIALNQIGEPCRQLLNWLFFDPTPPSHAEIATRLGRAVGGVGPLRGRCLEKLRALLEESGAL